MKRAPFLIHYSHDHQHGLAQALRLRRAAEVGDVEILAGHVAEALAFADGDLSAHMAEEESELIPLVGQLGCTEPEELERGAREHLRLRVLRNQLRSEPISVKLALQFAGALHDHIRWEERELFPAWQERIEQLDSAEVDRVLQERASPRMHAIADLQKDPGVNGLALGSLSATNVMLAPQEVIESAPIDRDVAYVIVGGSGMLEVSRGVLGVDAGPEHLREELSPGRTIALARGVHRKVIAGDVGLLFATVHVRRDGLKAHKVSIE